MRLRFSIHFSFSFLVSSLLGSGPALSTFVRSVYLESCAIGLGFVTLLTFSLPPTSVSLNFLFTQYPTIHFLVCGYGGPLHEGPRDRIYILFPLTYAYLTCSILKMLLLKSLEGQDNSLALVYERRLSSLCMVMFNSRDRRPGLHRDTLWTPLSFIG